jgi:hypothetical protein
MSAGKPKPTAVPTAKPAEPSHHGKQHDTAAMPFGKGNFVRLLAGIATLLLGFVLLGSDGFVDATKFSVSLYIAPFVIAAGYIIIGWAILFNPNRAIERS